MHKNYEKRFYLVWKLMCVTAMPCRTCDGQKFKWICCDIDMHYTIEHTQTQAEISALRSCHHHRFV